MGAAVIVESRARRPAGRDADVTLTTHISPAAATSSSNAAGAGGVEAVLGQSDSDSDGQLLDTEQRTQISPIAADSAGSASAS